MIEGRWTLTATLAGLLALFTLPILPILPVAVARADDSQGWAALELRFGGEGDLDIDGIGNVPDDDMEPGYGLSGGFDNGVHEHFMLGGRLSILSLQSDSGDDADLDRSLSITVAFAPTLRLSVAPKWTLFATLPLGLGHTSFDDDSLIEDGMHGSIALYGGFVYDLGSVGLRMELGYTYQEVFSEIDLGGGVSEDVDVEVDQFALTVGLAF